MREKEIINRLVNIYNSFEVNEEQLLFEPTMFWLISSYNQKYDNEEKIGGDWVIEKCPEPLKSLP